MANSDRDGSFQRLSLLYQENARVAAAFWEWQHKTLTIFTAGITALLAIEVWIYNNDLGGYTAIPPGAAALLSWLCMRFTERNRAILNRTYKIGGVLEAKIAEGLEQPEEPIFTWLGSHPGTYRTLLPRVFKIAVAIFIALTIAAIIHAPQKTGNPAPTVTHSVLSAAGEYWLWHSFRDVVRRVGHVADVASVIMCAVRILTLLRRCCRTWRTCGWKGFAGRGT